MKLSRYRPRRGRTHGGLGRAALVIGTVVAVIGAATPAQARETDPATDPRTDTRNVQSEPPIDPATGLTADGTGVEPPVLTYELAEKLREEVAGSALAVSCLTVALQNLHSLRYVSAEKDYTGTSYGMLRARAVNRGPYETFQYCWHSEGFFSLKSLANNRYVAVEMDNTGSTWAMLRARSASIGNWERHQYYLYSGSWWFYSPAAARWWRVETSYPDKTWGMVRATFTAHPQYNLNDYTIRFWRPFLG